MLSQRMLTSAGPHFEGPGVEDRVAGSRPPSQIARGSPIGGRDAGPTLSRDRPRPGGAHHETEIPPVHPAEESPAADIASKMAERVTAASRRLGCEGDCICVSGRSHPGPRTYSRRSALTGDEIASDRDSPACKTDRKGAHHDFRHLDLRAPDFCAPADGARLGRRPRQALHRSTAPRVPSTRATNTAGRSQRPISH
jgi:hypothetical protein